MALGVSGLYAIGALSALGQQQAQQSGLSQGGFTNTTATSNELFWHDYRRAAAGSPAERVQASLPETLRAELQEQVDAWLPKL